MIAVKRLLEHHLDDESECFVFPSEVAAEFWRREALKLPGRRAIWEDRFLSWDRFKEQSFALTETAAPINRRIRMLFAADLLRRNGRDAPIFSSLVNPAYADASASYLRALMLVLPELKRYRELCRGRGAGEAAPGGVDPDTHADLTRLWQRYHSFLRENGLFEPSYDRIDVSRLRGSYHVFFPEVIEDWKESAPFLDSHRIRPVAATDAPPMKIKRFDNAIQELRSLFREISRLLDDGVSAADIAITVPRLEAWESYLLREADLMDLPLDVRQGHALADYAGIGLFARLSECVAGGYDLDSLKSLFSSRAYPWRHRRAGEKLIRWGIDHHCAGRYRAEGRMRDLWSEKLALAAAAGGTEAPTARALGDFYASFTREVGALVGAKSFAALRGRLQRFLGGWLDTGLWKPESLRVFQFALDALGDLVEAEGRTSGLSVEDPYSLWLTELRERLYVPRSGAAGIPVYPYRVSAGIAPAHHFVVGATQAATQVEWSPLSFLREDERESLGARDTAATEEFLNLYLLSGSRVWCSYSAEDFLGVELPPGPFVIGDAVERPGGLEDLRAGDSYASEAEVWTSSFEAPSLLHRRQKEGAACFRRVAGEKKAPEATRKPLPDRAIAARVRERLSDEDGRLIVSATRLERFRECPFAFLFSTVLGAEEASYVIRWSDPRRIGALMHEILRRLFEQIARQDGRFDPLHVSEYRTSIREQIAAVCGEWEARGEAFAPPVWGALQPHLIDRFEGLLEAEAKHFGGLAVEAMEREYKRIGEEVVLLGRIDRISSDERGSVLIDYKRHNRTRPSHLKSSAATDEEGDAGEDGEPRPTGPSSFQIPLYVTLLEAQGGKVRAAAYYDIEKARYQSVFDEEDRKAWLTREELDELLAGTERAVVDMSERVQRGDWTVPDPQTGCEECRLRPVCRMKYAVR